ncbi:putative NADH-flavin reductase [Leucobacter exalbidus]|uniref:NADH-flavin reductase n=1 Tax=Leucobacter exalbidus TaxID=662960 RepID=A0A940PTX4_9MICO|nr:NAD(P)H-binding protein [Leucobacter exalbidus]MBP1327409.1 putative NADH-flavin reductase [Leucobacter exalbidus]
MAKITVVGGTGYAGSHIAQVAADRGHEVTSYSRSIPETQIAGVTYATGSILDGDIAAAVVEGADVVLVALSPRGDMAGKTAAAIAALAARARVAGKRIGVIGGAGSLFVSEGGPLVADTEGFPAEIKPEADEMAQVLADLRASDAELDWFFVSPAGGFGAWVPGEATGVFRIGGDVLLVDENGESNISGADLAAAIIDEVETPAHRRQRFTAAY